MHLSYLRAMLLLRIRTRQLSEQVATLPRALACATIDLPCGDGGSVGELGPMTMEFCPRLSPLQQPGPAVEEDVELHELSRRKMRGRKRRILHSVHKERRSARLAAKEPAVYVGAVDKASRVKEAKLNMSGVSRSIALPQVPFPSPSCARWVAPALLAVAFRSWTRWSSCAADEASPPLCGSRPVALLSAGLACFWHLPPLLEHVCAL